ncbi:MAG: SelB C-terminal domain-containing protein, partial [Holophagales bacterium]|nr:SelB C-terminal domain-containing protein [Holophagales bacterium]
DDALDLWVAETAESGLAPEELGPRLGQRADAIARRLDARVDAGKLTRVPLGQGARYVDPRAFERVRERARRLLRAYFRDHRLAPGMPKAEFLGRLLPEVPPALATVYLRFLAQEKVAEVRGDLVNPPGRKAAQQMTGEESALAARLLEAIEAEGLTPPSPAELAHRLGTKPQILEGVQKYLITQKKLARLPSGLILSTAAVDRLGEELRASDWDRFSVPQFKDRYGLTRKWAIPLLEHLDSIGITRRLGNERQVIRRPS